VKIAATRFKPALPSWFCSWLECCTGCGGMPLGGVLGVVQLFDSQLNGIEAQERHGWRATPSCIPIGQYFNEKEARRVFNAKGHARLT
jgi:hypothetical protein